MLDELDKMCDVNEHDALKKLNQIRASLGLIEIQLRKRLNNKIEAGLRL
jgi:hypothetical protein